MSWKRSGGIRMWCLTRSLIFLRVWWCFDWTVWFLIFCVEVLPSIWPAFLEFVSWWKFAQWRLQMVVILLSFDCSSMRSFLQFFINQVLLLLLLFSLLLNMLPENLLYVIIDDSLFLFLNLRMPVCVLKFKDLVSCRYNGQASGNDLEVLLIDVLQEQSREKLP